MAKIFSPLGYPGGKSKLTNLFVQILDLNEYPSNTVFIEPYAGGAGVALGLLFSNRVDRIILNDKDTGLYCFWLSVIRYPQKFIDMVANSPISIDEWKRQKERWLNYKSKQTLTPTEIIEYGFSVLFLNRCNRSGMLQAGPRGGYAQNGHWKLKDRFNKSALIERITNIAERRNQIEVKCAEALTCLSNTGFIFLDPPYYEVGKRIYHTYYTNDDHKQVEKALSQHNLNNWCLTYNDCYPIRELYNKPEYKVKELSFHYTINKPRKTTELFIYRNGMKIPK